MESTLKKACRKIEIKRCSISIFLCVAINDRYAATNVVKKCKQFVIINEYRNRSVWDAYALPKAIVLRSDVKQRRIPRRLSYLKKHEKARIFVTVQESTCFTKQARKLACK